MTPQYRVLVRARGLAAFRGAVANLATSGTPLAARRRAVIVPTRAAGELLRQTIERTASDFGKPSVILPDLLIRDQWVLGLHTALAGSASVLSRAEREVLLERAARETAHRHPAGANVFELRPGLVAAMLDFYDELRRRQRDVRRFVRALFSELGVDHGFDRGSETLIHQTCFLGFTFLAYQRAVAATGGVDEHGIRRGLIAQQPALPFDHLVVAVADHPSDPRGLWPADFDLMGRLIHLARIDIVVTDEAHDAGFRARLERELPGIVEERAADVATAHRLLCPPRTDNDAPMFLCRDREEEVRAVARAVRAKAEDFGHELRESVAIVFQRPLPYLYLAQQVLADARIPYQTFDALPLAAEPYAALLDLVLAVARTGGTREATVALLRSPLLRFEVDGQRVDPDETAALDAVLGECRVTGEAISYVSEVRRYFERQPARRAIDASKARRAALVAVEICESLKPFRAATSGSVQIGALATLLRTYEEQPRANDVWRDRYVRARAAVLAVLDELGCAFERHDNRHRDPDALTALIHHAIERQTFTPRRGHSGVHLVDAVAARFGEFDHVFLVGLVEAEWPERMRRNIFYSTTLLKALGWPQEPEQMRAEYAAFQDLLSLARRSTRLSAFQLDGDTVAAVSPMIEGVRNVVATEVHEEDPLRPIFADEIVTRDVAPAGLELEPAAWLAVRLQRPALSNRAYSGFVDARPPRAYRVSQVDRYVDCPFKYFSESVLLLPEERDELSGLTPLERGTLLHTLFERFYTEWQADGQGAITATTLPVALALFSTLTDKALERLSEADRALERTRLLGSIVGMGVAERVFELEADSGAAIRQRWLEWNLNGSFTFPVLHGLAQRTIEIRGKADRIDLLQDGTLSVIDYKLGRLPDLKSSIQIAVYAHCARQALEAADGGVHPISTAMYLAFGDDRQLEGALGGRSDPVQFAVEARAGAFAAAIEHIEAGEFPPRPKRPADCQWCSYAGVCRKEYQLDDEATEPV